MIQRRTALAALAALAAPAAPALASPQPPGLLELPGDWSPEDLAEFRHLWDETARNPSWGQGRFVMAFDQVWPENQAGLLMRRSDTLVQWYEASGPNGERRTWKLRRFTDTRSPIGPAAAS